MESGWVVLADMQYLRGYCILLADPVVTSLNDLAIEARVTFLKDMSLVGDALQKVTGAFRINYAVMGNSDPKLHAHIVPRYLDEPEQYRLNQPWSYPDEIVNGRVFDAELDRELIAQLRKALIGSSRESKGFNNHPGFCF